MLRSLNYLVVAGAAATLILAPSAPAIAQQGTGSIAGRVIDVESQRLRRQRPPRSRISSSPNAPTGFSARLTASAICVLSCVSTVGARSRYFRPARTSRATGTAPM